MRVFKSADSEFTFVFLNSLPKIPSLGKNGSKTFVLNKNWYVGVFKGSNSEFNNFFFFLILSRKYFFYTSLVPKPQSVLFQIKLGTLRFSMVLILNSTTFFSDSFSKAFFRQICSQNFKVICFKWNFVCRDIQGCGSLIWQLFPKILSPQYLFGKIFLPKLKSALFQIKLST